MGGGKDDVAESKTEIGGPDAQRRYARNSFVQRWVSSSSEHLCSNVASMWMERGSMLHVERVSGTQRW